MKRPPWLSWLTHHGEKEPFLLKYRSSEGFITGTIALAVFTDMFLYSVIVPVIPFAIHTRSHIDSSKVQYWVSVLIAIYAAALLFFSPICGYLADHTASRRSPLLIGLFALLGATILLNIGSSLTLLVIGRLLQGTSAAVVWVVGLALMSDTVPQERLAQAMGYVGAAMSVGILMAPLLGGVVYDRAGYGAVYAMSYGLIGLDVVLRLLLVEKKVAKRWTVESAEEAQPGGLDERDVGHRYQNPNNSDPIPSSSSTSPPDLDKTIASSEQALQTYTPTPTRRLRERLPPVLSLLYSRRLLAALFAATIQAAIMTSFDSVLTLHVARVFNWSSTGAALLFLPLVLPSFVGPLFGYISDKYSARYLATFGFLLCCPPLVCLRYINENNIKDKVLLCALLALIGLFLTMTFPPFMAEISKVVAANEKKMLESGGIGYGKGGAYAQAYALFNVAFAAGCMIGPLMAGFIEQEKGWTTMAWVLGLLSVITSVPTWLWIGGWVFEKNGEGDAK